MAAGDIRAGGAYVELFVKGNVGPQLNLVQKKLQQMGDNIAAIGKRMAGIGAAITAPLLLAAQRFASVGDEINRASQRTGVGVEQLTALKYAAQQSDVAFEDLENGIKKMQKTLFAAESGSTQAQQALRDLGLNAQDLKGQLPDQQLITIGDALSRVQDSGARAAIAMQIFGKNGTSLLPMFANGAAGMNQLIQRAQVLGLVFSKEDAEAATKFSDACKDLWDQVQAVAFQVGAAVAQALQPFAEVTEHVLSGVINWIKNNRTLVIAILGVGVALITAGVALIAFGTAVKLAGVAISGILSTFKFISAALTLLTNPIVLIGVGLVALAGYFLFFTETGGKAVAWLVGKFNELKATASETFGGIADALAAGDISLAAQILWAGLQLAWIQGTQELQNAWSNFRAGFVQTAAAAFYGAQEIYQNVKANLLEAFANTTAFLGDLWDAFTGLFVDGWNTAVNLFTDTLSHIGDFFSSIVGTITDTWSTAVNALKKGLNEIKSLWDDSFDSTSANQGLDDQLAAQKSARQKLEQDNAAQRDTDRKAADEKLAQQKADRQKLEQDNSSKREADRSNDISKAEADKQAAINELNQKEQAISAGASENAKSDIAALEQKKKDLQTQLDGLRDKAHTEKETVAKVPEKPPGAGDPFAGTGSAKASGIFNAAAIQALQGGGGTAAERTAKATEAAAASLKNIEKKKGLIVT